MNITEAKEKFRELVAGYFGDGHVFYSEVKMSKPPMPYLTIQVTRRVKNQFAIKKIDPSNGNERAYWEIKAYIDLNLYSNGKNVATSGQTPVYLNSTIEDLEDFLKYLDSEAIQEQIYEANMSVMPNGDVTDLTSLLNESQFSFRAMQEFVVTFTDEAEGLYGQNLISQLPNPSGGGSSEMVQEEGYFEDVEIEGGTE